MDAKFDRQAKRGEAIATAKANNISLTFLHCTAPPEVLKQRVTARTGDIADATADILAKQSMEPFTTEASVVEIDTTQSAEDVGQRLANVFV